MRCGPRMTPPTPVISLNLPLYPHSPQQHMGLGNLRSIKSGGMLGRFPGVTQLSTTLKGFSLGGCVFSAILNWCTTKGPKIYTGMWSTEAEHGCKTLLGSAALFLGKLSVVTNCPSSSAASARQFISTNSCMQNPEECQKWRHKTIKAGVP